MSEQTKVTKREAQRLETRRRVYEAAVEEFKRVGMAHADVSAIIAAADIARGTFYFHFPTKEHVLLELVQREQAVVARDLARHQADRSALASVLTEVVELSMRAERRLGSLLFRDVVAAHFSATYPVDGYEWANHPVIVRVAGLIETARRTGELAPHIDPAATAISFLLGAYALLVHDRGSESLPAGVMDSFVATVVRGIEAR